MSLFGKKGGKSEHRWFEERLSAYLDSELPPQERNAVEQHLAHCQDCQWNLKTLRHTVQWMRELPTVPVPRVFTIPVPARPARARQRTWGLALLQGATALAALLLVFTLAGDLVLTGFTPAPAAEPQIMKEAVVVDEGATEVAKVEVTREVEMQAAAPAAKSEEAAAEPSTSPEPPPRMAAEAPAPTSAPAPTLAGTLAPTPTAEASGMGGLGFETPAEGTGEGTGEGLVTEAPRAAAPEIGLTQTSSAQDTVAASPAPLPTEPLEPSREAEPTIVAEAPQPERLVGQEQSEAQAEESVRRSLAGRLQVAELVLGATFILLATTTLVVMIRRRQAR
jgi:anti-sigma factor RsiW